MREGCRLIYNNITINKGKVKKVNCNLRSKQISLSLILIFIICFVFAGSSVFAASDEVTLQIYSVNDFHGALQASSKNPGAAKLASYLKDMKEKDPDGTIIISAGDMFQGTADSNLLYGKPVIEMMNDVGFDAMIIGNHEFDWGIAQLKECERYSNFPYLAANILNKKDGKVADFAKPYIILEKKGLKVGIIGLTTPETAYKASPKIVAGLEFADPITIAKGLVTELRSRGVQIIIVASHISSYMDSQTKQITGEAADLAHSITDIDGIISGHSHQNVAGYINQIPIVQAPYNGRAVCNIQLTYSKSKQSVISAIATTKKLPFEGLVADPSVQYIIYKAEAAVNPIKSVVLGKTVNTLTHDKMILSPLGQWTTDIARAATHADIAFDTGGDLRTSLQAGQITMGDMYEVMPFDNTFYTIDMTGEQILRVLEYGIANKTIGMLQFSGLNVKYDSAKPQGEKIIEVCLLDGSKLDKQKTYKVVTNDYLYDGGDGYTMFKEGRNPTDTFIPVRDTYVNAIKTEKIIDFKADNRLIDVQENAQIYKLAS